jgi:competence protein ComEC
VLVARRVKLLDSVPRGRGALRGRVMTRAAELFGSRARLVQALVIAPNVALEPEVRERYARSGLAHLLSISGLHVGFLAVWLGAALGLVGARGTARLWATSGVVLGYIWLLGFPAPATRSGLMLVLDAVARWRQRVVAPRGVLSVTALLLLLADPWALQSVGAWLSLGAVAAVIWAGRAAAALPRWARLVAPSIAATVFTAPISALAFGTVAPIGVLANLVAIPLAGIAVPGLVLALVASWVAPPRAVLAAGSGLPDSLWRCAVFRRAHGDGGGWQGGALWLGAALVASGSGSTAASKIVGLVRGIPRLQTRLLLAMSLCHSTFQH